MTDFNNEIVAGGTMTVWELLRIIINALGLLLSLALLARVSAAMYARHKAKKNGWVLISLVRRATLCAAFAGVEGVLLFNSILVAMSAPPVDPLYSLGGNLYLFVSLILPAYIAVDFVLTERMRDLIRAGESNEHKGAPEGKEW